MCRPSALALQQVPAQHVSIVEDKVILLHSAPKVDSYPGDIPSHLATELDGEPIGRLPPATELEGDPTKPQRRLQHPSSRRVHQPQQPTVAKVHHHHL